MNDGEIRAVEAYLISGVIVIEGHTQCGHGHINDFLMGKHASNKVTLYLSRETVKRGSLVITTA